MSEEYIKARKAAEKTVHRLETDHKSPYLPVLDDMVNSDQLVKVHLGFLDIPLDLVTGTKTAGRQQAFAGDFMPLMETGTEFAVKWDSVYAYQVKEGISDPVTVYEYKRHFYVLEGNKRVSVLKYLDAPAVRADVTRVMPQEEDELYNAFLRFYNVCPLYEIGFSDPVSYRKLAEMMNEDLEHPWAEESVSKLKGAYVRFLSVFEKDDKYHGKVNPCDAFLTYMTIYGFDEVRYAGVEEIRKKLLAAGKEILIQASGQIKVRENPDQVRNKVLNIRKIIPAYTENKPLRIAFVYDQSPETSMYDQEHEVGRRFLGKRFGKIVQTCCYTNAAEGTALRDCLDKAAAKNDVVFTVTPQQMQETLNAAVRHPAVQFMNCSIHQFSNAVRTYEVRSYEVKFLMGLLAGILCENHRIAYIADAPVYGSIASANAFAIGVSMTDPKAEVYLAWSGVDDEDWFELLKPMGVNVFCGPDLADPQDDNIVTGLCMINEEGKTCSLAQPVINRAKYYEMIVQRIISGDWRINYAGDLAAVNEWWGISAGVLDINISSSVPDSCRKLIRRLKKDIAKDRFHPFAGKLCSRDGVVQKKGRLTVEEIIHMDWLNENVMGIIPAYEELNEDARKLAEVSGIASIREHS